MSDLRFSRFSSHLFLEFPFNFNQSIIFKLFEVVRKDTSDTRSLSIQDEDIFVDPKSLLGLKRWHSCSGWGGLGLQSDVDRFKATRTGGHLNISSKSLHFRARHQSGFGSFPSFQLIRLISFIGEKHSSDFCEKHCANSFTFWCFDIYLLAIQKCWFGLTLALISDIHYEKETKSFKVWEYIWGYNIAIWRCEEIAQS